jgi:hypothetical protein
MYINYYNAIKTRINQRLNTIKTVDWFNDQYNRYQETKAPILPAVYVEFANPLQWETKGDGLQTAPAQITLHLVVFDLIEQAEPSLALASELHKIMHRFKLKENNADLSTPLMRTSSEIDMPFDQLKVIKLSYDTTLFDTSTLRVYVATNMNIDVERI